MDVDHAKVEAPSQDINNWYPTKVLILVLEGPTTGKVTVELWCHHYWSYGISAGDDMISRDGTVPEGRRRQRHPAIPEVVEEGANAYFTVKTGYSQHGQDRIGFELHGGLDTQGVGPRRRGGVEAVRQRQLRAREDSLARARGHVPRAWNNTFVVQLRNELINQDEQTLFVIGAGMLAMIAEKPTFELIDEADEYVAGDLLEIRVSAELNPIGFPITGFIVSYDCLGDRGRLRVRVRDALYPALREGTSDTYFTDVKITFPQQGVVSCGPAP